MEIIGRAREIKYITCLETLFFKKILAIKSALIKNIKLANILIQKVNNRQRLAALFTPYSLPYSSSSETTLVVARLIPDEASVIPNV